MGGETVRDQGQQGQEPALNGDRTDAGDQARGAEGIKVDQHHKEQDEIIEFDHR